MKVYGTSYDAVAEAVVAEKRYYGAKADLVRQVTPHVLNWRKTTAMQFNSDGVKRRSAYRYVTNRVQRPSLFRNPVQFAFWPMIIQMVIQLVLDWLNSPESYDWREANR